MRDRGSNRTGTPAALVLLALALAGPALGKMATAAKVESPTEAAMNRVAQRFLEAAPAVGETLPADLEVYTAGGDKVSLQSLLMGHHTVLVLGCLT